MDPFGWYIRLQDQTSQDLHQRWNSKSVHWWRVTIVQRLGCPRWHLQQNEKPTTPRICRRVQDLQLCSDPGWDPCSCECLQSTRWCCCFHQNPFRRSWQRLECPVRIFEHDVQLSQIKSSDFRSFSQLFIQRVELALVQFLFLFQVLIC